MAASSSKDGALPPPEKLGESTMDMPAKLPEERQLQLQPERDHLVEEQLGPNRASACLWFFMVCCSVVSQCRGAKPRQTIGVGSQEREKEAK